MIHVMGRADCFVRTPDACADSRQFVLHAIVLGAHGDWLHVNPMREPFETAYLRWLGVSGVLVSLAFSAISGGAGAASCCDDLLDRFWADHGGVIADMDNICAPIDMDSGDVQLRAKGLLDRVGALDGLHPIDRTTTNGCFSNLV